MGIGRYLDEFVGFLELSEEKEEQERYRERWEDERVKELGILSMHIASTMVGDDRGPEEPYERIMEQAGYDPNCDEDAVVYAEELLDELCEDYDINL